MEVGEMKVKIFGPGCPRCEATETNVRRVLHDLGIEAEIEHIYDPREFIKNGITITPAVMVDGVLKFHGKVPTIDDLKKVFSKA
jgi:small redox-active disulfide protein 2